MPLEKVALIPRCAECEAVWLPVDDERWRAYLTDDEPAELLGPFPAPSQVSGLSSSASPLDGLSVVLLVVAIGLSTARPRMGQRA